mmetsp:Transcript_6275/g.13107  ORF Transcript_6275/g.13107 Transcript_6275/m.13107 type:complete len:96 (-) Transcript_6275:805-1092(-)
MKDQDLYFKPSFGKHVLIPSKLTDSYKKSQKHLTPHIEHDPPQSTHKSCPSLERHNKHIRSAVFNPTLQQTMGANHSAVSLSIFFCLIYRITWLK